MSTPIECDINKTASVERLLKVLAEGRDQQWYDTFYEDLKTASFACGQPQTSHGPDGFPYFELHLPKPNEPFESYCISSLADFLLENGLGVAINPSEGRADWVLSYGDILNLKLNGRFYTMPENDPLPEYEVLSEGEKVMIAQPSESYLPSVTRRILRSFLNYLGVSEPKALLLVRHVKGEPVSQLAFNIFPEDVESEEVYNYRLQQLCWFLPRHYIVVGFSKNDDAVRSFADL